MPKPSEALVYIESDGSARELTDGEKAYVDTDFSPFDGARPYIKTHYEQRTPLGDIRGYLMREAVPGNMTVAPAPLIEVPQPRTPEAVADAITDLIRRSNRKTSG